MKKNILFILLFTTFLYSYELQTDTKNVYFTSEHFRVISGVLHVNSIEIESLAIDILDIAEKTWNIEVGVLGFLPPRNTDKKLIDIYIANQQAYNIETEGYVTIPSGYAGYTTSYPSDNTPFFVLNPVLKLGQLQITIAHEFFHTIQHVYFDETKIDDTKWFKNIWWLEATAALVEDEVYDDINGYVAFLNPFYEKSYTHIETYDGIHEYATAIYAKFFKEKYGFEIIKESLSRIESSGEKGYFEILDDILQNNYNSSMQEALRELSLWVYHGSFEEGNLYPNIRKYSLTPLRKVEKGGLLVLEDMNSYIVDSNNFYNQLLPDATQNKIAIHQDVLVSNFSSCDIDSTLLSLHVVLENFLSIDGDFIFFPASGFNFIANENAYFKDENGVHIKIDALAKYIDGFTFSHDIMIKSFDVREKKPYEKFSLEILTRKKVAL